MVESRELKQFIILSRSFLGEKVFFVQPLLEAMPEISKKSYWFFGAFEDQKTILRFSDKRPCVYPTMVQC